MSMFSVNKRKVIKLSQMQITGRILNLKKNIMSQLEKALIHMILSNTTDNMSQCSQIISLPVSALITKLGNNNIMFILLDYTLVLWRNM